MIYFRSKDSLPAQPSGAASPTEELACGVFMRSHRGFSLIELLLVVAVILIIAAIAVPNFLKSRLRANEASAVASSRVINTAAIAYSITYPDMGFPAQLTTLAAQILVRPLLRRPA